MSDPVTKWLETFMCDRYAPLLSAHGYDTLQSICQLHVTKLVAMGIPLQHCHRIIENVSILRQTLSAEKLSQFDMNGRGMMNSCTQVPGGGPNGMYTNGMAPYMYDPSGMDQPSSSSSSSMSMPFMQYGGMMGGSSLASVDGAGYGHMFGSMSQQQQQQQQLMQPQGMSSSGYSSSFSVPPGDQMTMMSHYQGSGSSHYLNGSSSYAHFPQQIAPTIRPVMQQQQQQQQQNPQEIADSIYHMASSAYRAPPAPAQLLPNVRPLAQHPLQQQQPPHQHAHMSTAAMSPLCGGGGGNAATAAAAAAGGGGPMTGSYSPGPPYGRPAGMLSPVMGMTPSRAATGSSSSSHPSPTTAGGAAGPMSPLSIRSPSVHGGGGSHGQLSPGSVHSTSSPGLTPPPHVLAQSHLHRSSPGASHLMLHTAHHGGAPLSSVTAPGGSGIYGQGIVRPPPPPQHMTAAGMAVGSRLHPQQVSSSGQMMGGGGHPGGDSTAASAAGMFGSPLQSLERLAQISDKYPVDPKSIVSGGATGLHDAMALYPNQQHHHHHHHHHHQLQQQLQQQQQPPQSHLYATYAGHSAGNAPYLAGGYPTMSAPSDYLKQEVPDRPPPRAGPGQSKKAGSKVAAAVVSSSLSSSGKTKAPGSKKGGTVEKARKVSPTPHIGDGGRGAQKGGSAGGDGSSYGSSAAAESRDTSLPLQSCTQPVAATVGSVSVTSGAALQPAVDAGAGAADAAAAVGSQVAAGEHTLQALLSGPPSQLVPPPAQPPDRSRPPNASGRAAAVTASSASAAGPSAASVSSPASAAVNGGGSTEAAAAAAGAACASLPCAAATAGRAGSSGKRSGGPEGSREAQPKKSLSPLASSVRGPGLDVTTVFGGGSSSSSSSSSSADSTGSGFREDRCCAVGAETDGIPSLDACKATSPFGEDGSEAAADPIVGAACAGRLASAAAPAAAAGIARDPPQRQWASGEHGCESVVDGDGLRSPVQQQLMQQQQQLLMLRRQPSESVDGSDDGAGSQHLQEAQVRVERTAAMPRVAAVAAAAKGSGAAADGLPACTVQVSATVKAAAPAAAAAEPALSTAPAAAAGAGPDAQLDEQASAHRSVHPAPAGIDYSDSKNVPLRKRKQGLAADAAARTPAGAEPQLPTPPAPPPPLLHSLLLPPPAQKKQKMHAKKLQPTLTALPAGATVAATSAAAAGAEREMAAMNRPAAAPAAAAAAAETGARRNEALPGLANGVQAGRHGEREAPRGHDGRRWSSSAAAQVRVVPSAVADGGGRCRVGASPAAAPQPVASTGSRPQSLLLPLSDWRAPETAPTASFSESFRHRPTAPAAPLQLTSEPVVVATTPCGDALSPSSALGSTLRALMAASPRAEQEPSSCKHGKPEACREAVQVDPGSGGASVPAAVTTIVVAVGSAQPEVVKRKRGRPLGSKNKKKDGLSYKPMKKDKSKQGASAKRSAAAVAAAAIACQESTGRVSKGAVCPSPPLSVLSAQLKSAAASLLSTPKQVAAPKVDTPPMQEVRSSPGTWPAAAGGGRTGVDKQEVRVASFTKVGRVKEMSPRHAAAVAPTGATARSLAADDSPWLCVFCHEVSNCRALGDLFGPYRYAGSPCSPSSLSSAGATTLSPTVQSCPQRPPDTPESSKRGKQVTRTSPATAASARGGGSVAIGESRSAEGCSRPRTVWYHEDCVVWAPGVNLVGQHLAGLDEAIALGEQSFCTRCKRNGALLGCYCKGCSSRYHYICAIDDGCTLTEENFSTICPRHNRGFTAAAGVAPSVDTCGLKCADAGHQSSDSSETPKKKPRY